MAEAAMQAKREAAPESGTVIAATKLHAPAPRPGLVARESLVARLTGDPTRKLTLIDAPPGFGKTMLLSEWHASPDEDRPFAWLSLDRGDNDPVRFWTGVIDALRTVEPRAGASVLGVLRTSNVGLIDVILPLLINDLATLTRKLVLVLDDYHLITERRIHDSVAFLIDHLPGAVHVALATRADPPLPLGRYRAHGELTELRAAELRFSDAEANALLTGVLELDLDGEDIARLQRRTEGWPAGLYLAALSLRGRSDAREFIGMFAGDDRQIVDYLVSEVLAVQPEELRDFLLRTSILTRLSGPLCDAVTGRGDSAQTLERMERSNLFVVPLDHNRVWYRYHQLFGELLQHELALNTPTSIAELHSRAFHWYREQGSVPDAIHHAAAAGETHEACELIALHWNEFFNRGRLETVAAWLAAVPEHEVLDDPRLCMAAAWLAMDRGRMEEAGRWIEAADMAITSARTGNRGASVESEAAALRAVHSFKVGNAGAGQSAARKALEAEPEEASFARFVAHCILGVTLYWRGELDDALDALDEAMRLARMSGNELGQSYALGYLALVHVDRGELEEADGLASAATALSAHPGVAEHFVAMVGHLARGKVLESSGRLDEAETAIRRAVELSRRGAGLLEIASARLGLAQLRQANGDREEARRLLREARRTVEGCEDAGTLGAAIRAVERGLRLPHREPAPTAPGEELTDRELAILRLLKSNLSRREIGEALYVSQNTVKTHIRGIYRKLDASTREQAVARARERGVM